MPQTDGPPEHDCPARVRDIVGAKARLDYRYGKNTAAIIDQVADAFGRDI